MPRENKRQQFESTAATLKEQYGDRILRPAKEITITVPHVSTGFPALDALTGCGGIPLGAMTILSGISASTDGKVTIAYKAIAAAQQQYPSDFVALIDLHATADPDYLRRAGVDLERIRILRPAINTSAVDVLRELASKRKIRLIVVNSLADLQNDRKVYRHLTFSLGHLQQSLRATKSALIWIDDPAAPWLRLLNLDKSQAVRQFALLHIQLRLERWIRNASGKLRGYAANAKLLKSKWTKAGRTTSVEIVFNGTIKARRHW